MRDGDGGWKRCAVESPSTSFNNFFRELKCAFAIGFWSKSMSLGSRSN